MIGALLGADDAAKPVKELLEQVGAVVANLAQALGALLGGDGIPGPDGKLLERVGAVAADVGRALGDALGALVGGDGAPYPFSDPMAQPLAALYGLPERASELLEWSGAAVANLAQATGGSLSAGSLSAGGAPHQTHNKPFPAPLAPLPVAPSLPTPAAPGGYSSSSLLVGSGSGADAFQLLFAVLILFSVALLRGGRLSWLRRESHGPPTAFLLAIERPG